MKRHINPMIGIWWYTDNGEIWAEAVSADQGVLSGIYKQYSDREDHLTLWSSIVKKYIPDVRLQRSIISNGYKSIERGRVIYNTATMVYEITCSEKLITDEKFRKDVVAYFQLSESRYEFVRLNHYHKIALTGNPAVDEFIENNQY